MIATWCLALRISGLIHSAVSVPVNPLTDTILSLEAGMPPRQDPDSALSREVTVAFQQSDVAHTISREVLVQVQPPDIGGAVASREATIVFESPIPRKERVSREATAMGVPGPYVYGTIAFSGLANVASTPAQVAITVSNTAGVILYTTLAGLNVYGDFEIAVPEQDIRLSVHPRPWLRRAITISAWQLTQWQELVLVNGDIDGDNEISIGDFSILSHAYGSQFGEERYNQFADLDQDFEVAISDFAILSQNYGEVGDES